VTLSSSWEGRIQVSSPLPIKHRRNGDEVQVEEGVAVRELEKPEGMVWYETTMLVDGWISPTLSLKVSTARTKMAPTIQVQKENRVRRAGVAGDKS
jgi:hypothetical protein